MIRAIVKRVPWTDIVLIGCAVSAAMGGFYFAYRTLVVTKAQYRGVLLEFSNPVDRPLSVHFFTPDIETDAVKPRGLS